MHLILLKMGTFMGHVMPGIFFIILGWWWAVQILRKIYKSKGKHQFHHQRSSSISQSPTFPLDTPCGAFHIEVYVMTLFCVTGLLIELVIVTESENVNISPSNLHHATMYFTFIVAFLSVVMIPRISLLSDDRTITYILMAGAYGIEGLLFAYHSVESGKMHILMHVLLL